MPCHSAMVKDVLIVQPDEKVEDILKKLSKKKTMDTVVVLNEDGGIDGYMNMKVLLKNLLPVSVTLQGTVKSADMQIGAAPGIAKRLRKVKPLEVHAIMEREFVTLEPDAPVWVGVQKLVEFGSPIFVVEEKTQKYVGVMNEESAIAELERIQDEQGGLEQNAVSG